MAVSDPPKPVLNPKPRWSFGPFERICLSIGLLLVLGFGALVESRTALSRWPMTDLGVFSIASWEAWHGGDLYSATDWHGWHYQYPPAFAILFGALQLPPPAGLTPHAGGTKLNTPWGAPVAAHHGFHGLKDETWRFFWIVAVWYLLSVAFAIFSAHAIACVLEQRRLGDPPPVRRDSRLWWWSLRVLPILACSGNIFWDFSRGQADTFLLAAIAMAAYWISRNKDIRGGFFLALPAAIKLFPVLLLIYPAWRMRWRMLAGVFAALVLTLWAIPSFTLGSQRAEVLYQDWVRVLVAPGLGHGADTSRAKELTGMGSTNSQSLLAAVHNWRYIYLKRDHRPATAAPWERNAVYATGVLMLAGIVLMAGFRRSDTNSGLLIIISLLTGVALTISPVVHSYYHMLMLPLIATLLHRARNLHMHGEPVTRLLLPVALFALVGLIAPLPVIGDWIRDLGIPLLSMFYLLFTGAIEFLRMEAAKAPAYPGYIVCPGHAVRMMQKTSPSYEGRRVELNPARG